LRVARVTLGCSVRRSHSLTHIRTHSTPIPCPRGRTLSSACRAGGCAGRALPLLNRRASLHSRLPCCCARSSPRPPPTFCRGHTRRATSGVRCCTVREEVEMKKEEERRRKFTHTHKKKTVARSTPLSLSLSQLTPRPSSRPIPTSNTRTTPSPSATLPLSKMKRMKKTRMVVAGVAPPVVARRPRGRTRFRS